MIPPPITLNPLDPDLAARIAETPNHPGVYLLMPEHGLPYLGSSAYLRKRLLRLLLHNSHLSNSRSNVANYFARAEHWTTGSRLETSLLLYWLALRYYPDNYRKRLKLRDPWLLTLLNDEFPRLAVQNRLSGSRLASFGPFPNREAAERVYQGIVGLFQIRRCEDKLVPAEDHPGCIYGEMNLCLRPCQLAVSAFEYAAEVSRLSEFLVSNGKHAIATLTSARDRASHETEFEQAARLHKELEKVKAVIALRDDLVTELDSLNGLAVTRASGEGCVALWPMLAGIWQAPLVFDFAPEQVQTRSLDQYLRERLASHLREPRVTGNRLEELAILSRWYYSSWRDGQWLGFKTLADLNLRKLVREISLKARAAETPSST
jgi:excinuclease ABC subunit C